LLLVYSPFVCVCVCYACEDVVPVDVTLVEKKRKKPLEFAQVWLWNGFCYKNSMCV